MSATIRATSPAVTSLETAMTLTVTKPAGTVDGDLLLAFFGERKIAGTIIVPPPGWDEIATVDVEPGPTVGEFMKVYQRTARAEPADYTWTWDKNGQAGVIIAALDVHDGRDAVIGVATVNGTSHKTSVEFLTTEPDMLLLAAFMVNTQSSFTPPAVFAENEDVQSGPSNGITVMLCNKIQAARGFTGQFDATSANSQTGVAFIIGIRDPAVSEKVDLSTGIKSNVVNAVDASGGVEVLSLDIGAKQGLRRLLMTSAGGVTVRIEDTAGKKLFPDTTFPSSGGSTGQLDFERGRFTGGVGKAIEVKASNTTVVSVQIESDVIV